jgi:ABC-type arginine transport system ATPase subunit
MATHSFELLKCTDSGECSSARDEFEWLQRFGEQKQKQKKNSVAFSPQANYTDWATATCRRNLVPTLVDRGVSRGQRGESPTVVNLSFLDRSRYFSFK